MSARLQRSTTCFLLAMLLVSIGAAGEDTKKVNDEGRISEVVKGYFASVRDRDFDGIQAVLHESLTLVEASHTSSKIEVLRSDASKDLLPPPGNDDWEEVTISDISVRVSSTHPSVAAVSFVIDIPIDEEVLKSLREISSETMASFDDETKKRIDQSLREKSNRAAMFALLAKKRGEWKIVSLALPKYSDNSCTKYFANQ